jgi:glucose-1-phosphate thymidylyltransferase
MSVIVIEDPGVELLTPVTTARLAATISCGSLRLVDWLEQLSVPCYGISRPYLEAIQASDFPTLRSMHLADPDSRPQLIVSARLVPSRSNWQLLADAMARGAEGNVWRGSTHRPSLLSDPSQSPAQREGYAASGGIFLAA